MPIIDNVGDTETIETAWGNDVADTLNARRLAANVASTADLADVDDTFQLAATADVDVINGHLYEVSYVAQAACPDESVLELEARADGTGFGKVRHLLQGSGHYMDAHGRFFYVASATTTITFTIYAKRAFGGPGDVTIRASTQGDGDPGPRRLLVRSWGVVDT